MTNENAHLFETANIQDLLDVWRSRAKPIVIWAGAGLSAPAQLPTWIDLRDTIQREVRLNAESLGGDEKARMLSKLTSIANLESNWKAFELLEDIAPASFSALIRRALVDNLRKTIPPAYVTAWNLNVKGILTLNIDGFAGRAFSTSSVQGCRLLERSGFDIKTLLGTITDNDTRFVANLHGSADDPTTWVFTDKKLNALFGEPSYGEFVRDCIKYCTIVLLGVSANDKAIVDHFSSVAHDAPNSGPHFWLASADNHEAAAQVEKQGNIRVTLYKNSNGKHEFINDLFAAVPAYKSHREPAPPVSQDDHQVSAVGLNDLPSPSDLVGYSPNRIRAVLNAEATRILASEDESAYVKFDDFCKNYSRAIHSATFVSQQSIDDADRICGYSAFNYVKEGGFAKVWNGQSDSGDPVAIKVFRHEVREQPDLLKAFRRGVRSMRFLQQRNIPGVVKFIDASEIPPVVVMEWVEGITLHEAVKVGASKEWRQRVRIARDLALAVFAVHSTPERIVHRDLRPHNIMLRDFYAEQDHSEVVVLDFDLSWHLGALEKSVYISGGTAYLAPEQLNERDGMSTRSATVDSFGFGMTLYYLVSGADPTFFAHARPDWTEAVYRVSSGRPCKQWRSLPRRLARLIVASTLDDQNRRMTFSQIVLELDKLWTAIENPLEVTDLGLIAEEIFSRVDMFEGYQQRADGSFFYRSPSNISVSIGPHNRELGFVINFQFSQAGHEKYEILDRLGAEFREIKGRFESKLEVFDHTCNITHGDYHTQFCVPLGNRADYVGGVSKIIGDCTTRLINLAGSY